MTASDRLAAVVYAFNGRRNRSEPTKEVWTTCSGVNVVLIVRTESRKAGSGAPLCRWLCLLLFGAPHKI